MKRTSRVLVAGVMLAGIVCGAHASHDTDAPSVLTPTPATTLDASTTAPTGPTVRRARRLDADFAALDAVEAGPRSLVRLDLFDDFAPLVTVDRVERRHAAGYSWAGRVVDGGSFVLTVEDDAVHGAMWLEDGRSFEIRQGRDTRLWAVELDQAGFEPCAADAEHCIHAAHPAVESRPIGQGARGEPCPDAASRIDVMVVYTPAARDAAGGVNAVTALANSAIASANSAYESSGITTRLRMVHLSEVNYTESGSFSTDLSRLRNTYDPYMHNVHAIRTSVSADVVAMLNNSVGSCGVAYTMTSLNGAAFRSSAFSVTRYSCAVGNLTFAHEVGHNMGSNHDRENAGNALFNYSFGHRWTGTNGATYRSVMAYAPGSRVPRFSNPFVDYAGTPTGVPAGQPGSADNARSINRSASTMANLSVLGDGTPPQLVFGPTDTVVQAGELAEFFAIVSFGSADEVRWSRDGQPLFDDGRISGATTAVLSIAQATPGDAGDYRLSVGSPCGSFVTGAATLTVQDSNCPADLAEPFGTLNFFDVAAFLGTYNAGDPAADLAAPFGDLNFFDVLAYLSAFNAGCP